MVRVVWFLGFWFLGFWMLGFWIWGFWFWRLGLRRWDLERRDEWMLGIWMLGIWKVYIRKGWANIVLFKNIEIAELEMLFDITHARPRILTEVKEKDWGNIPPIPVIEIPEAYGRGDVKYLVGDGLGRHDTAIRTHAGFLAGIVYAREDDVQEVSSLTGGICPEYNVLMKCPWYKGKRGF